MFFYQALSRHYLASALKIRYDSATGTHQGPIEASARLWGNSNRSWRSSLRREGVVVVPKTIRILAGLAFYLQLNLMPTTHNAGNITPHEFYTGVRPSSPSHYKLSAMQLAEAHTGKNSKKIDGKQLLQSITPKGITERSLV